MKTLLYQYRFTLFWSILFIYIFGLCSLYPMNWQHDFEYNIQGNPFLLQWDEFFRYHGRLLTHILIRIIYQQGNLIYFIGKSMIIFFLFYCTIKTIYTIENKNLKPPLSSFIQILAIFLLINALFPFVIFMMYYGTDTVYLYSYYIPAILIICFLQYYFNIFLNHTKISVPILCLLAFLTGASFEMAIACIPMIITIFIILKIQKKEIPYWFWISIPFFFLGFSILLLSPGSNKRIDFYANASEWDFFGQTINWINLGWKKYFYTLVKNIFYASKEWYAAPGFLPSSWLVQLFIGVFVYLNYKKENNLWAPKILFPLLWWLFAWYTCGVMSASPMYYWLPVEFSKFFLYISLSASVYYFIQDKNMKFQWICSVFCLLIVFIGQGIQIPAIYKARQEYLLLVDKIEKGEISKLSTTELPTAKIRNIDIFTFGTGLYIKYPNLFE